VVTQPRVRLLAALGAGRPGDVAANPRVVDALAFVAFAPSVFGALILVGAISHIGWLFWNVTPREWLAPWLIYMGLAIAPLLVAIPAGARGRQWVGHAGPFWRRYFTIAISVTNLGIAASVWILLPHAPPTLQLYMAMLYAWYVLVLLHARDAADPATFAGVIAVLGSAAAFWLREDAPLRMPVLGFYFAFGVTTVALQRALHRSVQAAIIARYDAEDARQRLADALSDVSAERDAKARFIAAASHDLQQPVHAARLYFDLLGQARPDERAAALAGGRAAFRSVEGLLDAMLEHLRLEADAVPVRAAPVELDAVFGHLARQFTPAAAEAGVTIVTSALPAALVTDPDLLQRALGNLIDNAIKHANARQIELRAAPAPGGVTIHVRDDGIGLSAENADRLFDTDTSFRRAAGRTAPGFGLGLPSARRIAQLLGATLAVSSTPGEGCAFTMTLPVSNV